MIIEYIKYIQEHRRNIRKACKFWFNEWQRLYPYSYDKDDIKYLKKNLRRIKLTHDLSKYSHHEFKVYAENFFGNKSCDSCAYHALSCEEWYNVTSKECKKYKHRDFDKAWLHHFRNNKHHWNHYCYCWNAYDNHPGFDIETYAFENPREMPQRYITEMIIDWTAMSYKFGDTPQEFYLKNYNKIRLNRYTRHNVEIKLGLLFYNGPICEGNPEYWMTIKELKEYGCYLNDILKPVCIEYNIDFNNYDI